MKDFILANAKALTALVVTVIAALVNHYGLKLDAATEASIAALVVALAVFLVPNTPKPAAKAPSVPPAAGACLLALACAAMVSLFVACLNAKDAHDIENLDINTINCIESQPSDSPPAQVAITCGIRDIPGVIQLIIDLLAQKKAAEKAGVYWTPIKVDGGAP